MRALLNLGKVTPHAILLKQCRCPTWYVDLVRFDNYIILFTSCPCPSFPFRPPLLRLFSTDVVFPTATLPLLGVARRPAGTSDPSSTQTGNRAQPSTRARQVPHRAPHRFSASMGRGVCSWVGSCCYASAPPWPILLPRLTPLSEMPPVTNDPIPLTNPFFLL